MARAGSPAWDEDEAFFDERPLRRARRKPVRWFRVTLMSCLMIGGLVYFAKDKARETGNAVRDGAPSPVLIAPAPAWAPIASPSAPYLLENASGPLVTEARQHTSGAREDTLILGRFGQARHARISLVQGAAEPARSFFVDIVRRAAQAGLAVSRNSQSRMVMTKFGPVEAAAMTLVGDGEQECQAFRFSDEDSGFGFQGWLCDSGAEDARLACFINGVGLSGAASPSLKALFARAGKNRTGACETAARAASASVRPPPRP